MSLPSQVCALKDARVRLQQLYNECNHCIHGGAEAAAAAGCVRQTVFRAVVGNAGPTVNLQRHCPSVQPPG